MTGSAVYVLLQDEDYGNYAIRAVCSTLELAIARSGVEEEWKCPVGADGTYWWCGDWAIERHSIDEVAS